MILDLTQLVKAVDLIISVLKLIISILTIPVLIIMVYSTVVRLVESINQLQQQPDVKTIWAKIIQILHNFGTVEKYNK